MQYIEKFLTHLNNSNYSPLTIGFYKYYLNRLSIYFKSKNILTEQSVTSSLILEYLKSVKANQKYSFYYKTVIITKKYFQYLEDNQLILFSPLKQYRYPKQITKHHKVHPENEINEYLNNMIIKTNAQLKLRVILELIYSSALRINEVINLQINDINYESKTLKIHNSKFGNSRIIPVTKSALIWIKKYIDDVRSKQNKTKSKYLFIPDKNKQKKLTRGGIINFYNYYCKANNLKHYNFHSIRATAATHLYLNGMGLLHIQKLLGHSKAGTTEIYIRLTLQDLQKELNQKHPTITKRSRL